MNREILDFRNAKVLVVGDTILDRYVWGTVQRISPEAPVPVLRVRQTTQTLGGAANVAHNLVNLGCPTTLIGVCGADPAARSLEDHLQQKKIKNALIIDAARPTIAKTRVMAQKQQMIRLDEEATFQLSPDILSAVLKQVDLEIVDVNAVIISDYGKGLFADGTVVQHIVGRARQLGVPVLVDPKGTDWHRYEGATCVTPNTAELEAVAGKFLEEDESALIEHALSVHRRFGLSYLLVTRGAKGMGLFGFGTGPLLIEAQAREVFDVSGAGDTVIAVLAACMAAGMDMESACRTANMAAGIVVGKVGTQPVLLSELLHAIRSLGTRQRFGAGKLATLEEALPAVSQWKAGGAKIVFTNGCFDLLHPGHVRLLHQARAFGDRLIVGLNSDASVRRLKGEARPILGEQDRAAILSALESVDLVITFNEDTPLELIKTLQPDVLVKGADYAVDQVVGREEVESHGGRVQLVPLIPGHSTSLLAEKMKQQPA